MDNNKIDTGDYVHHAPSNENWIVALVEDGRLYWMGYPFGGSAALEDCTLTKKATPEFKERMIKEIASANSSARPVTVAKALLEELNGQ